MYTYADKKEEAGRSTASAINLSKQLKKNKLVLSGLSGQAERILQRKWHALMDNSLQVKRQKNYQQMADAGRQLKQNKTAGHTNNGNPLVKQRRAVPAIKPNEAAEQELRENETQLQREAAVTGEAVGTETGVTNQTAFLKTSSSFGQSAAYQRVAMRQSLSATGAVFQLGKDYYENKNLKKIKEKKGQKHQVFNKHLMELQKTLKANRRDLIKFSKATKNESPSLKKKRMRKLLARKRNITEVFGEWNATDVMNRHYSSAVLLYGFTKGVGIDQVWQDGSDILVVEAKGPGAKLGISDRKGSQMSESWVEHTAKGMKDKTTANLILTALKNKKNIKAIVVVSTTKGNPPKKPTILWEY